MKYLFLTAVLLMGSFAQAEVPCLTEVTTWSKDRAAQFGGELYGTPVSVTVAEAKNFLGTGNVMEDKTVAASLIAVEDQAALLFDVLFEGSFSGPGASSSILLVDKVTCAVKNEYNYFQE